MSLLSFSIALKSTESTVSIIHYMNTSRLQGIHCYDIDGRLQLYIRLFAATKLLAPM